MITLPKEVKAKTVISDAVKLEMKDINNDLTSQKTCKKKIISYLREYTCSIDYNDTDDVYDNVSDIASLLKKCDYNVFLLEKLLSTLLTLKVSIRDTTIKQSLDIVDNYNKSYLSSFESINLNVEKINEFLDNSELLSEPSKQKSKYIENTLIISEIDKKVILPYSLDTIYETLKENKKFKSVDEVINKVYTMPLKYFKNAPVARFREAYKLVKERENGTSKDALDLALELALNRNLHPAIITACRSLDELDIYLSCLEYNELDDFHFFKIIFKIPPFADKSLSKINNEIN